MKVAMLTAGLSKVRGGAVLLYNFARSLCLYHNIATHVFSLETDRVEPNKLLSILPPCPDQLKLEFVNVSVDNPFAPFWNRSFSYIKHTVGDVIEYTGTAGWNAMKPKALTSILSLRGTHKFGPPSSEITRLLYSLNGSFDIIYMGGWHAAYCTAVPFLRKHLISAYITHALSSAYIMHALLGPKIGMIEKPFSRKVRSLGSKSLLTSTCVFLLPHFDAVAVSTPYEYSYLRSMGLSNVYFVGEGIDLDFIKTNQEKYSQAAEAMRNDHVKYILYLGARTYEKGYYHALAALKKVANKMGVNNIRFIVIGRKEKRSRAPQNLLREALEAYRWLKQSGVIVEYNYCSELEKYAIISLSDILLLPSMAETIPLATLEAWALKKPYIGAYLPTIASIVEHDGDGGYLVDRNDIESITETILRLLTNRKEAELVGKRGYEKVVTTYNLHSVAERLIHLYKRFAS